MTEVSNAFITIIVIIIGAILIFAVPVVAVAARNDVTSAQIVQAAVTDFADQARETGIITEQDYNGLLEEVEATGNAYDLNIEIQHLDENPAKKTSSDVTDTVKIGENVYYVEYTTQIEEAFDNSADGTIRLVEGDYLKVSVENINETLYQVFKKLLYNLNSSELATISGTHAVLITNSAYGNLAAGDETYTIKYIVDGNVKHTQTKYKNVTLTLEYVPTNSDSTVEFAGWAESPDGEVKYLEGGSYNKNEDITLYAVWTKITYMVAYKNNSNISSTALPVYDKSLEPGSNYIIWGGRSNPSADGADFIGWNTEKDGSGTQYSSGSTITITDNLTLYAMWDLEEYKLTYDENVKILYAVYVPDSYKGTGTETSYINKAQTSVNYLNSTGGYYGTVKALHNGEMGEIVELRDEYDVIIIDCYNWQVSNTGGTAQQLKTIANETNIITIGNDERSTMIPFISKSTLLNTGSTASIDVSFSETSVGKEKIGEITIASESDNNLYMASFNSSTKKLYTATYTVDGATYTGDAIGLYKYNDYNWIHCQMGKGRNNKELLYALVKIAYEGWNGENKADNMPVPLEESHDYTELVTISTKTPTKEGYKFFGWSEQQTATKATYEPGDTFRMPNRDVTLYAVWGRAHTVEYEENIKVLYALYICPSDVGTTSETNHITKAQGKVDVLNENDGCYAKLEVFYSGEFDDIFALRYDYDVIILDSEYRSIGGSSGHGGTLNYGAGATKEQLEELVATTNLITIGDDETGENVPFVETYETLTVSLTETVTETSEGQERLGGAYSIPKISRSGSSSSGVLASMIKFSSDTHVLYTVSYETTAGAAYLRDAIGYYKYNECNWIHSQIPGYHISGDLMYKLVELAYEGWDEENKVKNMPENELYTYGETVTVSDTPTREGYTLLGWSEDRTASTPTYKPGDTFVMPNDDVTLFVIWGRAHTVEYKENVKVLYAVYSSWRSTSDEEKVNYLNSIDGYSATLMTIYKGKFNEIVALKNDYDVIVIDASYNEISTFGGTASQIIEIAAATNLITIGDDETSNMIPFISSYTEVSGATTTSVTETTVGNSRIGSDQTVLNLVHSDYGTCVQFNASTKVLFTGKYYYTSSKEEISTGDIIGFCKYKGANWIHSQAPGKRISEELMYKLVELAYEGWGKENKVYNLPTDEKYAYGETVTVSTSPTRDGYTLLGWSEDESSATPTYRPGSTFVMPNKNVTLYAIWSSNR